MSYRDFTFQDVKLKLGLRLVEDVSLYDEVVDVQPSPMLADCLRAHVPLALGINTEKARSELIIAPVLLEVLRLFDMKIGFFSGKELNVDPTRGLVGVCDFLLSLSPERFVVTAPVVIVVEAKNLDMAAGIPQCLAEMVAAQEMNEDSGVLLPVIHGAVTTGSNWRFLRVEGRHAWIDQKEYYIDDVGRILGALCHVMRQAKETTPVPP